MTQISNRWLIALFSISVFLILVHPAQAQQTVRLEIRLRDSGGTAVSGETVTLQRLPEETSMLPNCTTRANGVCVWHVGRGLYQVFFTQPLDDVSALALAEGGLRGFGITVGDAPITYHFTLQRDDHVYFDAAPEAIIPVPIVPSHDSLHGGAVPTPAITLTPAEQPTSVIELVPVEKTATPTTPLPSEIDGETAVDSTSNPIWHLLGYMGLGLLFGGAVYAWPKAARRRSRIKHIQSPIPNPSTRSGQVPQFPTKESDHA